MNSSTSVPVYPSPCLAADEDNKIIYLLGVSPTGVGTLEASVVSLVNVNAPAVSSRGSQVNVEAWSTNAPKACFTYPSDVHPNSPIMLVQYGAYKSYMTIMAATGEFTPATFFEGTAFMSPRLFSMVGDSGDFAWFVAQTNETDPITKSTWVGVRLNFTSGLGSVLNSDIGNFPTSTPLLSVGTYGSTVSTAWQGNNVVFDTQGGGLIYPSIGAIDNQSRIVTLSTPKAVTMNGISLSTNGIPVTVDTTGYILDKATDGSTAIYSITPSQSTSLERVTSTGGAPPFNPSMVAVAMNKLIVTYSMINATTAYFNTFDTTTSTWAGLGLVGGSGSNSSSGSSSGKSTPLGAIIGGVVGGLVVIALIVFLFIRSRRNKHGKDTKDNSKNGKAESDQQETPHVYTYVPATIPAPIVQQPVFFEPNAVAATNAYYDPNAIAVPITTSVYDPNVVMYDQNTHIYDQGLNSYEAPGAGAYPPPPPPAAQVQYTVPPPVNPSPYLDPAMSPISSQTTKTGSPANPQFIEPHSYASPKQIGSPQYVEAEASYKVPADTDSYRA